MTRFDKFAMSAINSRPHGSVAFRVHTSGSIYNSHHKYENIHKHILNSADQPSQ